MVLNWLRTSSTMASAACTQRGSTTTAGEGCEGAAEVLNGLGACCNHGPRGLERGHAIRKTRQVGTAIRMLAALLAGGLHRSELRPHSNQSVACTSLQV